MFDVFYIGENESLKENVPFAKPVNSLDEISPRTKMYWVIESNIELIDYAVLNYRPPDYDQTYEHVWKWNSKNYGGIKLLPKKGSQGVKEINRVVCKKTFDVLYTETPGDYFEKHKHAEYVWCVDPEYKLSKSINWAPDNFEPDFIHSFHLRGQLEHKYPEAEGGIKLYPRNWVKTRIKYHRFLDAAIKYPVLFVDDPTDYAQRDIFTDEYVWLIDKQHKIDSNTLDWVPDPFEQEYTHSFRMPYQLTEKYPESMGGIRLVPVNWKESLEKIHPDCPIQDEEYDVFYTNKKFNEETFEYYAKRSDTDWFWIVDRDYDFNGKLLYVPADHEEEYIHVFKWGLEHRYDPNILDLWDDRVAGIYLVHKDFDVTKQKLHTDIVPVRYDIFFTDDINNYEMYARRSRTEMFWLIDKDHIIAEEFKFVPADYDQPYINVFKLPGQLEHKYPRDITNVSDNRCGGIKLVPKNYNNGDIKYQGLLTDVKYIDFERYDTEEEGRKKSTNDWFWVVDEHVELIPGFNFTFTPEVWDEGKTHVWQKLNPKTKRQYDYGGVKLCPKVPAKKGRPKYIKEPACSQKEFPVFQLEPGVDVIDQLEKFDLHCDNTMYWVVEPFVRLAEDFDYDYYPSQWDEKNVHVFLSGGVNGKHENIRLIPKGTFANGHEYSETAFINNTFEDLKLMNTVASLPPRWPDVTLVDMTRDELVHHILENRKREIPFFWTIDADVDPDFAVFEQGFLPNTQNLHKVHTWQRLNPNNGVVHSYGGLRLWPTSIDVDTITTDTVITNKIKGLQYVRTPGCWYKKYDVVLITYHDDDAEAKYEKLKEKVPHAKWVKDVDGIFEAHKAAAEVAESKMFWVVDADAEIEEDFDFGYVPDQYDQETVHVWESLNPVTGDKYGYGGVKLFNRQQVLDANSWGLDFTTGLSKNLKVMNVVSCTTKFNTDEYSAWRSAFREVVKLSLKRDKESKARLAKWLEPANTDADFYEFALKGAQQASEYVEKYGQKPMRLAKINDYEWLRTQFDNIK